MPYFIDLQLPLGQDWLIDRMQLEGYKADQNGVCFGIANMGMQAILAEDTESFDDRLGSIFYIPKNKFVGTIKNIKNQRKVKKGDTIILYEEIPAFFEGIELYQNGAEYPQWFSKEGFPKNQNTLQTADLMLSQKLSDRGGISRQATFSGVYELKELTTFFSGLAQTVKNLKEPVALILTSSDHAICIGYNPKKQEWLFIDGNHLPTQHITSNKQIAKKVLESLSENKTAIFSTSVYTLNSCTNALKDSIHAWQDQKEFKKMHKITANKLELCDSENATWLYVAVEKNHIETVKKIIEQQKGNLNKTLTDNYPVLCLAALRGYTDSLKILIEEGNLDPNIKAKEGETPLYKAIQKNHIDTVKYLVNCNKVDINLPCHGRTPLQVAASKGNVEVIRELLQAGVDINQATADGKTPLYIAAESGHFDAVVELIKLNANVNKATLDGKTPLFIAAQQGCSVIVEKLLEANADPNKARNLGTTPLLVATQNGHIRVVKKLLAAKVDPNYCRSDGVHALYQAAEQGHLKLVKTLLKAKSNPLLASKTGVTPLMIAAKNGHRMVVKQLLKYHVNINAEQHDGMNALDLALENKHLKVAKVLLKSNGNINHQFKGTTALYRAAQNGNKKAVKLLLDSKANPNLAFQTTVENLTALGQKNGIDTMDLFIKIKKSSGNLISVTPLEIARLMGHTEIVNLLKQASLLPQFSFFACTNQAMPYSNMPQALPVIKVGAL